MKLFTLFSCSFLLVATTGALADTLSINPNADTYTRPAHNASTDPVLNIYGAGGNDFMAYIRFSLPAGAVISDATFTVYKEPASRDDTVVTGRFANFGLLDVSGNTPQNWDPVALTDGAALTVGQEYGAGDYTALTTAVTSGWLYNLDADNGANVTETIGGGGTTDGAPLSLSGPDLVGFLNGQIADGGQATIISAINATSRGYGYASVDNADSTLWPTLDITYTVVPEPSILAFLGLGLFGFVARLRRKV